MRAKAVPFNNLPKNIQDALSEIEEWLMRANSKDETVRLSLCLLRWLY